MMSAVRCCNARLVLPSSNLTFARHFCKKNKRDPKDVASKILDEDHKHFHKEHEKSLKDPHAIAEDIVTEYPELPEEPTTCCMSGCANCVWLDYAEKISQYYKDGGEKAMKQIGKNVNNGNIKAFLLHELRMRNKDS